MARVVLVLAILACWLPFSHGQCSVDSSHTITVRDCSTVSVEVVGTYTCDFTDTWAGLSVPIAAATMGFTNDGGSYTTSNYQTELGTVLNVYADTMDLEFDTPVTVNNGQPFNIMYSYDATTVISSLIPTRAYGIVPRIWYAEDGLNLAVVEGAVSIVLPANLTTSLDFASVRTYPVADNELDQEDTIVYFFSFTDVRSSPYSYSLEDDTDFVLEWDSICSTSTGGSLAGLFLLFLCCLPCICGGVFVIIYFQQRQKRATQMNRNAALQSNNPNLIMGTQPTNNPNSNATIVSRPAQPANYSGGGGGGGGGGRKNRRSSDDDYSYSSSSSEPEEVKEARRREKQAKKEARRQAKAAAKAQSDQALAPPPYSEPAPSYTYQPAVPPPAPAPAPNPYGAPGGQRTVLY